MIDVLKKYQECSEAFTRFREDGYAVDEAFRAAYAPMKLSKRILSIIGIQLNSYKEIVDGIVLDLLPAKEAELLNTDVVYLINRSTSTIDDITDLIALGYTKISTVKVDVYYSANNTSMQNAIRLER